jgi:hypothetical protein
VHQVHHRRREELRVCVDRQVWINRLDREPNVPVLRVQHPGRDDFVDERQHLQARPSLLASFEADFGQCAVDDFAKAHQAAAQDRSCAAVDGDGASLERVERENRGVQAVSDLVSGVAQTFDLSGGSCLRRHARVLRDSLRDRRVETPVESMEFFH